MARTRKALPEKIDVAHLIRTGVLASVCPRALIDEVLAQTGKASHLGVRHLEEALQVADISDIQITADPGQIVAPPPVGASYLGFIFARGISPDAVESALRQAHQRLLFDIQSEISVSSYQGDNNEHSIEVSRNSWT